MLPYNIPDTSSDGVIADWAEFYVSYTQEELSKGELSSYIEESSGSEPPEDEVDNVWLELERRIRLYGEHTPFKILRDIIQSQILWQDFPEYMTCLILSLEGNPINPTVTGRLFERISSAAVRNFFSGESVIYGFPSKSKVEDLAKTLNEKFIHEPPPNRKDRGLDIIAWKPFGDQRCSQPILLIQCAAGHNWHGKLNQLSLDAWCKYIHFAAKPIKGFSIPAIITDQNILDEISSDAGIIIDRARIYKNTIQANALDNLRNDLTTWCNQRLIEIRDI